MQIRILYEISFKWINGGSDYSLQVLLLRSRELLCVQALKGWLCLAWCHCMMMRKGRRTFPLRRCWRRGRRPSLNSLYGAVASTSAATGEDTRESGLLLLLLCRMSLGWFSFCQCCCCCCCVMSDGTTSSSWRPVGYPISISPMPRRRAVLHLGSHCLKNT